MTSLEMRAFWHGQDQARHEARIAAFGAIRRAAAVARACDVEHRAYWDADDGTNAFVWSCRAYSVRQAIRAAIGSEKA